MQLYGVSRSERRCANDTAVHRRLSRMSPVVESMPPERLVSPAARSAGPGLRQRDYVLWPARSSTYVLWIVVCVSRSIPTVLSISG